MTTSRLTSTVGSTGPLRPDQRRRSRHGTRPDSPAVRTARSIQEQDTLLEPSTGRTQALSRPAVALTRDPAVADDVVSEAFLRLASALRAGRAPPTRRPGCTASRSTWWSAGRAGTPSPSGRCPGCSIAGPPVTRGRRARSRARRARPRSPRHAHGAGSNDRHDGGPRLPPGGDRRNHRHDRVRPRERACPGARPAPHAARARRPVDVT